MKIEEIATTILEENGKLLKGMSDKKAKRVVRSIINVFAKELDKAEEGKISIQGLGVFVKKRIEKDGEINEKIIFKRAKKSKEI